MTELEPREVSAPVLPDFTNPAIAARAWADEVEQKLALASTVAEQAPKVEVYDRISEAEGSMCLRDPREKSADAAREVERILAG